MNISTYTYDPKTGSISFNDFRRNFGNNIGGPAINLPEPNDLITSEEYLGFTVQISEESKLKMEQLFEEKKQRELNLLREIYGEDSDKAPKTYDEITETDRALLNMRYEANSSNISTRMLFHVGENMMELNALNAAMHLEYLNSYFSDEAIMKRIEKADWNGEADRDAIFEIEKAYGDKMISEFNRNVGEKFNSEFVKNFMKESADKEIKRYVSLFNQLSHNLDRISNSLIKSFEAYHKSLSDSLFNEKIEAARELIRNGFDGDFAEQLRKVTEEKALFNLNGAMLTKSELEEVGRLVDDARQRIENAGFNMSYSDLGKLHLSIYNEILEAFGNIPGLTSQVSKQLADSLKDTAMNDQVSKKFISENGGKSVPANTFNAVIKDYTKWFN